TGHRRAFRRYARRGGLVGQSGPREAARLGGVLRRHDDRAADSRCLRAFYARATETEAALRPTRSDGRKPRCRIAQGSQSGVVTGELAVAIEAAREAGVIIRSLYGTALSVVEKGDRRDSPLTEADTRANQAVERRIREAFPGDGWLSEESRDTVE